MGMRTFSYLNVSECAMIYPEVDEINTSDRPAHFRYCETQKGATWVGFQKKKSKRKLHTELATQYVPPDIETLPAKTTDVLDISLIIPDVSRERRDYRHHKPWKLLIDSLKGT